MSPHASSPTTPNIVRLAPDEASHALRHQKALEINDNVVQGLVVIKYALDAGDHECARHTLQAVLESARRIVTDLLNDQEQTDIPLGPGDLIRLEPANVVAPTE